MTGHEKLDIAKLALNGVFDSARLSLSHDPYRSAVGTLSGVLDLKMGPGGQIDLLTLDTRLAQGYISADTYPEAIAIKEAGAQLRWQADQLNITRHRAGSWRAGAVGFQRPAALAGKSAAAAGGPTLQPAD